VSLASWAVSGSGGARNRSETQGALIVQMPCDQYTTGVRNLYQEWYAVCRDSRCSVFYWVNRGSSYRTAVSNLGR
jgi:hypothetical protein